MTRKRNQKKTEKKVSDRLRKLEKLRRAGQDEAFLELACQVEDLVAVGLAESYAEILERCLQSRLGAGDLAGLEDLLRQRRPELEDRPIVGLSEAVLALDKGELAEARRLLESLHGASADLVSPGLVRRLEGLCWDSTALPPKPLGPEVDEFLKLRRTLIRHATGELKRLPTNYRLERAANRRLLEFLRALARVRPGKPTDPKSFRKIVEAARALRRAEPTGASSVALLDGAADLAFYLSGPAAKWPRPDEPLDSSDIEVVISDLGEDRAILTSMLTGAKSPLLAPLRGKLFERLRSLLERIAEVGGSVALARVAASAGSELVDLLEVELEDGISPEQIDLWGTVRNLIEQRDYFALARALHRESELARDPSRLVRLWGLELWALGEEVEMTERFFQLAGGEESDRDDRAEKRRLLRLRAMSRELGTRFSDDDLRRRLARVLRRQILVDSPAMVSEKALPILTHLLRYLPEDRALSMLALASSLAADQKEQVSQHTSRIANLSPAPEAELDTLTAVAISPPIIHCEGMLQFYRGIEPLFGDHWPRVCEKAAVFLELRATVNLSAFLEDYGPPVAWPDQEEILEIAGFRRILLEDLDGFRALFGSTISFQASELLVHSVLDLQSSPENLCAELLAGRPELEAALSCLRLLDSFWEFPNFEERLGPPRQHALVAMLQRLDDRWWLWSESVKMVFHDLDPSQLRLLRDHLQALMQEPGLDRREQNDMEYLHEHVLDELRLLDSFRQPKQRAPRSRRKKARAKGKKAKDAGQLDLFDLGPGAADGSRDS